MNDPVLYVNFKLVCEIHKWQGEEHNTSEVTTDDI
jgi:hypothetical protein